MKRLIGALVCASALTLGAGIAGAAAPDQPCNLTYGPNDTIVSPGAIDCIVRYADQGDAIAAIHQARDVDGEFIWPTDEGVMVSESSGFTVRASSYTPQQFLPLVVIMSAQ